MNKKDFEIIELTRTNGYPCDMCHKHLSWPDLQVWDVVGITKTGKKMLFKYTNGFYVCKKCESNKDKAFDLALLFISLGNL